MKRLMALGTIAATLSLAVGCTAFGSHSTSMLPSPQIMLPEAPRVHGYPTGDIAARPDSSAGSGSVR